MAYKAIVIDDDVATLELMKFQLDAEGFDVTTAENGQAGITFVAETEFDIILTDLNLPDFDGIEMVRRCKEISPDTEIIMITGFGSTEKTIEATKAGAFHYVEKPIEFEELLLLIEKAIDRKRQSAEIKELRGKLSSRNSYEGVIGGSRAMQDIYEIIESVAESDANIFILGESGTGKEVIANAIHYKSHRSKKPFVKLNCSALPKELIESELFGHKKGSFTGAIGDKEGFLGRANGGSLLLDEIGEMPASLQPKLLRVLQERIYYRVGDDKPQSVDFRLISSTNRNPFDAIQDGNLREDLYYRINTIEIKIPPLRERMEDVPMLAEHFLEVYGEKYKRNNLDFSERAYEQMLNYNWRGNVRELQHVIERAILLSKGGKINELNIPKNLDNSISIASISKGRNKLNVNSQNGLAKDIKENNANGLLDTKDLKGEELFEEIGKFIVEKLPEPDGSTEQNDVFNSLENGVVLAALKRTNGNKQAAANLLGLYRPRLYGMIKRHNLDEKI
ncbi:MAG: sigma-54-dependent Fis family transcriptional regulator [Acidobacteria bacterium]|jgi:DNA-binding NtrC family response regulator|nr:sigma-54-dependent Fis family transcriptional regulator [Acidobacteriota bacterium]